jgi:hypothetical protein
MFPYKPPVGYFKRSSFVSFFCKKGFLSYIVLVSRVFIFKFCLQLE